MRRHAPWLIPCILLAGCGGGNDGTPSAQAGGELAATPERAGEVWELAEARVDETPSPADIAAFVEGLHVFVLDGDRIHAGNIRHDARRAEDGSLVLTLAGGVQARLAKEGDGHVLHLGEGTPARLQRRQDPAEGSR